MPELSAPVRVTWDLPPDPDLARALWGRLCEARVLFVEVHVAPTALAGLSGLAHGWAEASGPRPSLLGRADPLLAAFEALGPRAVAEAEVKVLPPYRPERSVEALAGATHRLGPALWCDPEGLGELPEAVRLARAYGLSGVDLLNPPAPARPLSAGDRARAAELWRAEGEGLEARVHDLFLARDMGLDVSGYRGCQGASFLAHVTAEGRLVACRTHPVDLGDLASTPLTGLWAAPRRAEAAARLGAVPEACGACGLSASCRGGCPGLAGPDGRDASCPGPVPP
ncbi:hypothetical protein [Deferrisoma palaeochoriense]